MDENASTTTTEQAVEQVKAALPLPHQQAQPIAEAFVQNYIATRRPLPDVRQSKVMKAREGAHSYLSSSMYEDGRLGEIMLTTSKEGMAWFIIESVCNCSFIGLQYGNSRCFRQVIYFPEVRT